VIRGGVEFGIVNGTVKTRSDSNMTISSRIITAAVMSATIIVAFLSLASCGFFVWLTGTQALPDNLGFGYYRDFDIARKAILRSDCAESIKYGRHEDLTLEDFHFRVHTKSGRIVLLFFRSDMDVDQVCESPKGILVLHPWRLDGDQGYSIADLTERLKDRGIEIRDIKDMLCNIDEIIPFFEANYDSEALPVIRYRDDEFRQYLHIRIMGQTEKEFFSYPDNVRIR